MTRFKIGKVAAQPAANMDYYKDYERKRAAAGLSDAEVCAQAGVANSTVTRARRDRTSMTRRTHALLCEAMGKIVTRRVRQLQRAGITVAVIK